MLTFNSQYMFLTKIVNFVCFTLRSRTLFTYAQLKDAHSLLICDPPDLVAKLKYLKYTITLILETILKL